MPTGRIKAFVRNLRIKYFIPLYLRNQSNQDLLLSNFGGRELLTDPNPEHITDKISGFYHFSIHLFIFSQDNAHKTIHTVANKYEPKHVPRQ